jgi:hypothetical protein
VPLSSFHLFLLVLAAGLFPGALLAQVNVSVPDAPPATDADTVPDAPALRPGQTAVPDAPALRPEEAADPVAIVATFEAGKTYRFVNRTVVRMQLPGRGVREVVIEQQARFDATKREGGKPGVALKARTERLLVDLRSGEQEFRFDSLKEEDRKTRMGQHFRASLNRWVDLELNTDNRIVSSEIGGRAGIATPLPGVPQFGPDELRQLVGMIPQGLPEDKVRPGNEWVLRGGRGVGDVGEVEFDITYRYLGSEDHEGFPCYRIDLTGRLSGDVAIPTSQNGAFSCGRMDFQGTGLRGRILFDPKEKTVRQSEQTIRMEMELPGGPGEQPVKIPVEQSTTLRLLHVIPTP